MSARPLSARRRFFTTSALGTLACAMLWAAPAHAQLVPGAAPAQSNGTAPVINQSGTTTDVTLGGSRTVIDWDRFDINSGDTANFIFANRSDIVLNRVGGGASTINGNLNGLIGAGGPAGGNIWIYNANGVVIGANARVNTGGLLVTTAALDRADDATPGGFLDGSSTSFNFSGAMDGKRIDVRTGAQVNTRGGALALISPIVNTEAGSTLTASGGGNVLYGSASGYKINFRPTSTNDLDLLSFEVSTGAGGYGGTAYLQGDTSGNRVFVSVVSQTGLVSQLVAPGAITATNVATDETGAIVLTTNHNIVNGAASANAVANSGNSTFSAGDLTGPDVSLVATGTLLMTGAIDAAGGNVRLISETGNIHQNGPKITANTLSASAAGYVELGAGFSGTPNSVARLVGLTSASGYISFAGDTYEIVGPITTPGGVGLSSTGMITGAGLITAGSLSLDATGTINVSGNANLDYSNSQGNLTIRATGNIAMRDGWRLNGHILNLTSDTGSIIQSGDAIYNGGTLNATAAGDIDFGQSNYVDAFSGTSSGGGDIGLKTAGNIGYVVNTGGDVTIDAGGVAVASANLRAGSLGVHASNYIDLSQSMLDVGSYRYLTSDNGSVTVTTNSAINIAGDVTAASGNDVSLTSNAGAITQTTGTITGRTLNLLASGSILQNGTARLVETGMGTSSVRAGDDLILAGANQISNFNLTTLGWGAGSDVTYRSANRIYFDGGATPIGALTLIADNGNIQQGNIAFTANSLTASATQGIELGTSANNSIAHLGNITSSTGEVSLRIGATTPMTIDGAISSASRVLLTARGVVSGSGTIAAPQTYLDMGKGGTINIAGSTTLIGLGTSAGDLTVNATGGLAVNAFVAGNSNAITLNAAGGDIIQTGGSGSTVSLLSLTASGNIDFGAGAYFGDILAKSTGGGDISLNTQGGTNLEVDTTGGVSLAGASYTVAGASHASTLTANLTGDLTLDLGSVDTLGALTIGHDLTLTATGNIVLGDDLSAGNILSLISSNGAILQTAGTLSADWIKLNANTLISQGGSAKLNGRALSLTSGGNVTLGGANVFTDLNDLQVDGDLTLRNQGSIDLDPVLTGGYNAGFALNLTSDTGSVTGSLPIAASSVTASAAGSIDLNGAITRLHALGAGGNIAINSSQSLALLGDISGADVSLRGTAISQSSNTLISGIDIHLTTSTGAIDQNVAARLSASNLLEAHAATDLLLRGANDLGYQDAYLTAGAGEDAYIRSVGDFRYNSYGITVGTLTLISDTGSIRQGSGIYADTLIARAATGLRLDGGGVGNTVTTVGGLTTTSGDISFSEGNGFNIAGDISAPGLVQLGTNGAITTSAGHLSAGTLEVAAGGGATIDATGSIELGAVDTFGGGAFSLSTTGDIELTGAVTTGSYNLTLDTSNGAITRNGGTISVNYNGSSGITYATAAGGIDLASAGSGVIWATSTGGGNINLSGDSDIGFRVETAGDLTVTAAGSAGNNNDVIARSVGISADAGISLYGQTVTIDVGSYRYLTAAGGSIDIENKGDINLDGNVTAGGTNSIRLNSSQNSLLQNSGTIDGYSVELKAAGSVTQDASAKVVTGDGGLSLAGTDVMLIGANEFPLLSLYTVSRDLTLRAVGNLDMSGTANQAGSNRNVTLISDTGNILGGVVDADKLTATATNGSLIFNYGNNRIRSLGALTAKSTAGTDIDIFTDSLLELTGNITGGGVKIYATQGINQTGGAITADRLFTGTAGNLLLGGANDFGALLDFGHANNATVTIRNRGDIAMPSTPNSFGTLTLTSDLGRISQTNAITAATLNLRAVTGIDLSNTANNFTTLTGLSTTAGNIGIGDTSGFTIEGDISAASGIVALTSTGIIDTGRTTVGGVTTPHGKIDADTITVSGFRANLWAKDDIKLGNVNVTNGFTLIADRNLDLTGTINASASLIATTGSITQSGGSWNTSLSAAAVAAGDITLLGGNNLTSFYGQSNGGGTIRFNNAGSGAINLGLSTTGSAAITVAGNLTSSGITADSLSVSAGDIDLTYNVDVNRFTGLVAAYGDVRVTNAGSFTVAGDVSARKAGLRSVNLWANGGGISQTAGTISANDVTLRGAGDLIQSGTARIDSNAGYFSGANVLLGGANDIVSNNIDIVATGDLTLRNAGSIDLDALGGYTTGGVLSLTSDNGSITSGNAVTASALTALAANGAVSFTSTDNLISEIRGLSASTNATVRSRNGGFTLTGDIDVGGTLALYAGTGINQTGGRIKATTLDAQLYQTMTTGSVLLGGANDVDNLYVLAASGGGDVLYRDVDGFNVTYAVIGNRATLTADAGAITQATGFMDGVQANQLTVSAVDGISLNNQWNGIRTILGLTNTGTGGIDVGGSGVNMVLAGNVTAAGQTVSLTARNASLTQTSGAITASRLDATARTGITLTQAGNNVAQLGTLSNSVSGGIAYTDANGYNIVGNIDAAGQTLTLGSMDAGAGIIRQAGSGSLITAGTLNVTGPAFAELRGPTGTYGNAIDAIGDVDTALILNLTGAVDLRGNVVTNYLELRARGAVTQSGGKIENLDPNSQVSIRGASISLTSAANQLGWMEALSADYGSSGIGDITLVSLGDIRLGNMHASNVSVTAAGNISAVGASQYRSIGTLAASAGGAIDFGGAIDRLGAITGTGGITLASSVDLALTDIVNAGLNQLTLHSDGALSQIAGSITAGAIDASAGTGIDLGHQNFIAMVNGLSTASGDITYRNRSNIVLPDVNAPGRLTLISDTGSITQGSSASVTAGTLTASAADTINLMGANHIGSLGALTAADAISIDNQEGLTLTGNIAAASVMLTSSTGAITQTGGTVTTGIAVLAAGGDVTLDRANAVGEFNAWAGVGRTVTLRNAGDLVVKAITAQNGTVNLTSNSGSVGQQVVPGYAIWTRTLNANAATIINLGQYNFVDTLGDLSAAGSIRFNSAGTVMLGGNIHAGGALAIEAGGYIGQLTGTITADHLDLTASGIALTSANDIGSTNASHLLAADDITFRSANSILLGSVSTPGLLSLTSDTGGIRQIAAFSAGRLDAMAAGDIVLDQLNTLDTLNDVTAGGVFSLRTTGALELDGRISAADRVTFNTGGGLTQIGNTVIVTDLLEATAGTATTTGIRLLNHNRVGAVGLGANGYDVRFRNTGDIEINAINAPTGTVELISNLGKITQQAPGGLVAGSLVLDAGNGVELYNRDNQIARLDVVSRGDVSIITGASGYGGILDVTRIDAAGRSVSLHNGTAGVTGGNITADRLQVFGVLSIDLGTGNDISGTVRLSSRDITFTNTGDLILEGLLGYGGNAVLRSEQGAIGMTNGAIFATEGLTAYGQDGVVLAGGIRRIDGLSAGAGADVSVSSDYALDIAGDISARNVELLSNAQPGWYDPTGGMITQSGGIITADRLIARARGDVTLDRANQIAALGWTVSTTGNVSITSADALALTDTLFANGEVMLDAASINQSGGRILATGLRARAAGALSLDAVNQIAATGRVTLDAGADIVFRNDNSFVLGTIDTPGAAKFTSLYGSIGQAAATRIGAGRLTVGAVNGAIALDAANLVDTLDGLAAGDDIVFRTVGDLALDGDIVAAGHEVTLRSNTGAISQTSGAITALGLDAEAGGAITLGGANDVTNLRNVIAGGDILYRNAGALMLWGDVTAAGHEVTLGTDSGSLLQMLFTSGVITANRLNARAGGALNLNHANRVNELGNYAAGSGLAGFTNDGSFALTGDVSGDELVLTALSGGISQASGIITTGSILATAVDSIDLSGANLVSGAGPVRLNSSNGNVAFRALNDFTLDFGSAAGTFDITSNNGSIGQSGAITANLLNARAGGNIALTSNNAVAALGVLIGEDIAFNAAGDLLLTDAIDAGGAVTLVASAGEITQSGGTITAATLNVSARQDILLGQANTVAAFSGSSVSGNITLRTTGSISLDPIELPGVFTLTSDAGAVTKAGYLIAGGLTITAQDGITLTRGGNVVNGTLNLANSGTGGIAYTGSGNMLIGSIDATGQTVTLSVGGDISQTAGIEAALLNLIATGDVTLTQSAGNLIGALGTVGVHSLTLVTAGNLDLAGAITVSDALSLTVNGALSQSGGLVTAPSLSLTASNGIDLGSINQVDVLTATNSGGSGDIRFVNGRSLTVNNLSSYYGDLTLRLTSGQLMLGSLYSFGDTDIDAAGGIGGAGVIDSRQSMRVVSGGSIHLRSVTARDDMRIDAAGDTQVEELIHLAGGSDVAGNGYIVDILGNNVTLGASDPGSITSAYRLYAETSPVVRIGARAGNALLNLNTMNHGVSIAATGDVRAYVVDSLKLVDVSGTNVSLTSGSGDIEASRVDVAGNYSLAGRFFNVGVLQPLGVRAGSWTLTTSEDLDALGRTLEYGGDIDFAVGGTLNNGSVRSLAGAVALTAGALDLSQISAATGVDVTANAGDLDLFSADTAAGNLNLTGGAVRVAGSLEAGADVAVRATTGDATIGYATAGRNITLSAQGDATLRQANLTGATGDLLITAGGNATLGDDDAMSGIGSDRWFERATGSTGMTTITAGANVAINLDHSAKLDNISGRRVEVNVATGDLAIGSLIASTERGIVNVLGGSLVIGGASATGSALNLYADGDLTLLSSASASSVYLTAGGLLDARTATVNGASYVELTGGEIRAAAIDSGGDIDVLSTAGAITVDSVHSTGGNAILNAYTDLNLGRVIANGGQLQAGGDATVRAITAPDGFALVALGNVTLGADTAGQITSGNLLSTGGSLGGCACGSGGATLISLNGSVNVNLQSATGVFDTIAAAVDGNASVHVATGDLGIGDLAAHNIAIALPGGTLTVMNAVSSGGDYTLTARDFGGNALLPAFGGGATTLDNVSITDTDGDFAAAGSLVSAGDIRISSVGNITGTLSLAGRDVEVTAKAIRLGSVTGRDVILAASVAGVDVVGAVTVGRSYTLTGSDLSANALAVGGARLGDLLVTDTAGDFAYGTLDLGFAGAATIRANGGAIRGGDIATLGNLDLSAAGIVAGTLRSDQGGVRVDSSTAVDLAGIRANNIIDVNAGGYLRVGNAALTGTGVNDFTLAAGGDLLFGAADAASIGSGNVFTSAGSAMTGGGLRADGAILVNLDRAAALTGIDGGILEMTVRNGDLSIGNIRTVGAMFVTGPSGTLSIGDAETSAGHIGIAGQGNVTTGDVSGRFVVSIGSSAGSVAFRKVTGGDVTITAASGITAAGSDAGVFADSLGLSAGGNVDLATNGTGSRIGRLRAITVANGDFALHNLQGLALDGAIDVRNGTLDLQVAGALDQSSGAIAAQHLVGNIAGQVQLGGANRIASLGDFSADGLLINNATALAIDGVVDGGTGSVTIRSHGGMTIGATGAVRSVSTGDAITLASDGLFRNLGGGTALTAANGRWLVYTQASGNPGASDPANAFGGLAGLSFYGAAYDFAAGSFGSAPNAGNRFVYGYRPVLTVRPNDLTITYNGQIPVLAAGISGLVNGDSAADAWTGAAGVSGAGRNAGTYTIAANLGSLTSDMNYDFAFDTGTLRIDPRAITATLAANGKVYDGMTSATGTLSLGGLVAGDDVTVVGALDFADKNAGAGKTVTASGIALNGTDAGNYTVNLTATGLADILARAITATLVANGKTYDGTVAATGTLSLGGVLGDDDVGVSGALAFADKNAGVGKIVTANGIALSGADAGNYVVNATATGLADILARTITATLAANGKTYDGTVAATGILSLAGVLAGDTVNASGDYAFTDKNAGTGKTVTASGIALGGADAGNYAVNATVTGLADILARAITATLAANGKTYDGTTAATGTVSLGGVLAGDQVGATGSYAFADKNAGTGKTVTASGITLSGADAGNYVANATATGLADILARAITATLAANGKTYDGTTAGAGTLSLGGVLAGDQVGVTGGIAFDSRNAGERIVTASGLTLGGADAGNYIVNSSATDIATIARLGITGTAVADSRIYDGTVTTTGRVTLGGVLAGDVVSATAGYAFADPNAGIGRVVAVNGLALAGADAGNYTVTLNPGPVLADILLRPVTVRADDLAKIFGMRDPALTWRVTAGSLAGSDAFTGLLGRAPGEQAGVYAVGQGSLALSSNYALTFVPGSLTIQFTRSGADASDVLKRLRPSSAFSLYVDPSANLQGDGGKE